MSKEVNISKTVMVIQEEIMCDFNMKFTEFNAKLIDYFDRMIKKSYEYKTYINYLKNTMDLNRCSYYENYSLKNGFKLEMHHFPFTIYEYTETICNKLMETKGYLKTADVCEEVLIQHYKFNVGLLPLNPTAHELYHSGNLPIHPDLVIGDWEEFVKEYNNYMSDDMKLRVAEIHDMKKEDLSKYPRILKRSELDLEVLFVDKIDSKAISKLLASDSLKRLKQKIG